MSTSTTSATSASGENDATTATSATTTAAAGSVPDVYKSETGLKKLAGFLRSTYGVKIRAGIVNEKRVDYFKGARLIESLLTLSQHAKLLPKELVPIEEKGTAMLVASALLQQNYFLKSEKIEGKKGYLRFVNSKIFDENSYFTWIYEESSMLSNFASVGLVIVVLLCCMMPAWPRIAKVIVWYIAVTFLLVIFGFLMIRWACFLLLWILGYDFWIFPRLFDETLSVVDSFKPVYSFDRGSSGQMLYRMGLLVAIAAFCYWAFTQPTEFDGFIKAQQEFVDDLYSGNLLSDTAFNNVQQNIERQRNRVPNLDDLIKQVELDNLAEKANNEQGDDERFDSNSFEGENSNSENGEDDNAQSGDDYNNQDELFGDNDNSLDEIVDDDLDTDSDA